MEVRKYLNLLLSVFFVVLPASALNVAGTGKEGVVPRALAEDLRDSNRY